MKFISVLFVLSLFLASCIKNEVIDLKGEGTTIIKILGGGTPATVKKNPVDFINTPQRVLACDIRKDAPNPTELARATTVVIKDDTAAVRAANPAYLHFPAAWYTIESEVPKVGGVGGTWTFTFKDGDFAKQIFIIIPNATVLNPSALYGLGFTIQSVSPDGKISFQKSIVVEIGAKNNWDGRYAVTGPMVDVAVPTLTQWNNNNATSPISDPFPAAHGGAWEAHLITTGATECIVFDNTIWGLVAHPILNAGAHSGYAQMGIVINFDPLTNKIARIHNFYGDPTRGPANALGNPALGTGPPLYASANTRRLALDPSGANEVQGNRNILIKYHMFQPSVVPSGPRTFFDETWKYVGSR
ncbi:MAG: hypothetical protein N2747_03785 [Chitinophagaceae bacterium]|nr:hypothetical protein [Chitinophagaceae bacterium]